ncbi:MAG: UMP kinase [Planctomycetes bacterium]|nr:UMP kinase [Planctomycetota bacterium]
MADESKYKRILVKLSGEAMCGPGSFGIEANAVAQIVQEIIPVHKMGVQTALVVGGGNFIRGRNLASDPHIQRTSADYMGMLATVINALALQDALEKYGVPTRVLSAITMTAVCEPFIRRRAMRHLEKGRVVILAGGTGSPFFSTDTCASLRASEINAEVLLKATKVDGVFDSDPVTNPSAKRYEKLTYQQVLAQRLGVMDLTAISMCMESRIPIVVFKVAKPGNLAAAVRGQTVGTTVSE